VAELIGREIAGFRIEREIGRGGMGIVYLATQVFPERRVALKLLSSDLAADPVFRERFVRESNAAASTEHPNIVPVYGAGESEGQLYLAMRYIEGTDLGSLVTRQGALQPERAARICAQVAEALEAAHKRGLVHRDVKPANVLLDDNDHAYLSDFGLTRRSELQTGITQTGQFMGTVGYVAPEQIRGEPTDRRADIYSLGCVLYESLTGDPPFRRDSEVATLYAQLENPSPRPSDKRPEVPTALDQVVAKATAKRPADRFATAGEVAGALRGGPVPDGAWGRRVRWPIAAGLAVVVAIVTFVTFGDDGGAPTDSTAPSPTITAPPLNSVVRLEGETGEILNTLTGVLAIGPALPRVEVGEGGVWITHRDMLTHVDPDEASVLDTIAVVLGADLAVGYRTIWLGAPPGIVRIDPIDYEELRPVRLSAPDHFWTEVLVALGASNVWAVTGDGVLSRIEHTSGERTGSVDIGQTASDIVVGFEAVWVIDKLQGTLTRVDPETLAFDEPLQIGGSLDAIEAGAGALWLLDQGAGIVTPIDPVSGSIGSPVRVGLEPTDLVVGLGAVWVANHGDGTISQIDPVTRVVDTIQIGAPVAAIAVDESTRSIWIVIAERRE
jgi:Protein kinase domain